MADGCSRMLMSSPKRTPQGNGRPDGTSRTLSKPPASFHVLAEDEPPPSLLPERLLNEAKTICFHEAGHALVYEKYGDSKSAPWKCVSVCQNDAGNFSGSTKGGCALPGEKDAVQNMAGLAAEALRLDPTPSLRDEDLAAAVVDEWLGVDGSNDRLNAVSAVCGKGTNLPSQDAERDWDCGGNGDNSKARRDWASMLKERPEIRGDLIKAVLDAFKILREEKPRWEQLAEWIEKAPLQRILLWENMPKRR